MIHKKKDSLSIANAQFNFLDCTDNEMTTSNCSMIYLHYCLATQQRKHSEPLRGHLLASFASSSFLFAQ